MWAPGVRDPSSLRCEKPHPLEQQRSSSSSQSRLPCEESNFGLHSQAHHLARSQEGQWLPRLWPLVSSPGTEVLHRQNRSIQRSGRLFVPHRQQADQKSLQADDVQMDCVRHQGEHLGRGSQADGLQNQGARRPLPGGSMGLVQRVLHPRHHGSSVVELTNYLPERVP